MLKTNIKRLSVLTISIVTMLSLSSCAVETGDTTINSFASETNTSTVDKSIPEKTSDSVTSESSDEEQIAKVVAEFFTLTIMPFSQEDNNSVMSLEGQFPDSEEDLPLYESYYDLNQYMNYDDLTSAQKIEIYTMILANKNAFNGTTNRQYVIDTSKISVLNDKAIISGEGIILRIDTSPIDSAPTQNKEDMIIEQNAGPDIKIGLIKTENGWKIDANTLLIN